MWIYETVTGRMLDPNGDLAGTGYSGAEQFKNDPVMEGIHNKGPIPRGLYYIGKPQNTVTHGPYVLPLTPDPSNTMFGRYGFLIHGDSIVAPGTASEGCIIMPRGVREAIAISGDMDLRVIAKLEEWEKGNVGISN